MDGLPKVDASVKPTSPIKLYVSDLDSQKGISKVNRHVKLKKLSLAKVNGLAKVGGRCIKTELLKL